MDWGMRTRWEKNNLFQKSGTFNVALLIFLFKWILRDGFTRQPENKWNSQQTDQNAP